MGIICYLAYWLTSKIIPINALCTLFAIMVAVVVYAVVLIISGNSYRKCFLYECSKGNNVNSDF